jgi:hypothetical protein
MKFAHILNRNIFGLASNTIAFELLLVLVDAGKAAR